MGFLSLICIQNYSLFIVKSSSPTKSFFFLSYISLLCFFVVFNLPISFNFMLLGFSYIYAHNMFDRMLLWMLINISITKFDFLFSLYSSMLFINLFIYLFIYYDLWDNFLSCTLFAFLFYVYRENSNSKGKYKDPRIKRGHAREIE
jgi:hypothetical protein